jgi:hypothetical protein
VGAHIARERMLAGRYKGTSNSQEASDYLSMYTTHLLPMSPHRADIPS